MDLRLITHLYLKIEILYNKRINTSEYTHPSVRTIVVEVRGPSFFGSASFLHTAKIRALSPVGARKMFFKGNIPDNLGWLSKLLYSKEFRMNSSSLDRFVFVLFP